MRGILKVFVSAGLVIISLYLLDIRSVGMVIRDGNPIHFIMSIFILLPMFVVLSARWQFMIRPILKTTLSENIAIYFKATFMNSFTPANLGGDAYRLVSLKSELVPGAQLAKILIRERILGFYGYVLVFSVAYIYVLSSTNFNAQIAGNPYIYGVMVAAGAFILPLVARPLGGRVVLSLRKIIGPKRLPSLESWLNVATGLLSPKGTLQLMILTIFGILLWIASIKVVAEGFGLSVPLAHLAVVATLVELVRLIPITIQGIGLREGLFAYLLAFLGHSPEQSYVVGMLAYLALSVAITLCGPIGQAIAWRTRATNG